MRCTLTLAPYLKHGELLRHTLEIELQHFVLQGEKSTAFHNQLTWNRTCCYTEKDVVPAAMQQFVATHQQCTTHDHPQGLTRYQQDASTMHDNGPTNLQCILAGRSKVGDFAHGFGRSTELLSHKTVFKHRLQKKHETKPVGMN